VARVLRVLCLIQERRGWNLDTLAAELECSKRTVQRDLDVLEACGIPWFYDEQTCCYRVREGYRFPGMAASSPAITPRAQEPETTSLTPAELGQISMDSAERLLEEAQRLIRTLNRLCQTLRSEGQPPRRGKAPG
jgi:predicted DNA-binding transcriptional regulator YafY